MMNLVNIHGRCFWSSFDLRNAQGLPTKNCMGSILFGSFWMSPLFASTTKIIRNYNQLATQASSKDATDESMNKIIAVIGNNTKSNKEICNAYVDKLCKAGSLTDAVRLLHHLLDKNICIGFKPHYLLLSAAGEKNDIEILTQVFKDLVASCKSLPMIYYLTVAKAFMKTSDDVHLLRLVREVSKLKLPMGTIVMNKIIFAFGECGQFGKALLIFDEIKDLKCKPDLITYNTILDILGRAGQIDEMLRRFASMKEEGIVPDFISYNTLLNQLKKLGRLDLCVVYFREMVESGIEPDLLTYTALIDGFGRSGNIEEALKLFSEMQMRKIRPSVYIYRSLVNNLKKMGRMELARTFLEAMNASLSDLAGPMDFKRKVR